MPSDGDPNASAASPSAAGESGAKIVRRVLPAAPYKSLDEYIANGGGAGLAAARAVDAAVVLDELQASGLRGRGGAGFPTATKWRTIIAYASPLLETSIVVNAAEGEPGTFKDRSILRANPYAVIEGALIAAQVIDSRSVTIATKRRFGGEIARLRAAIAEVVAQGWAGDVEIDIAEGPTEYLFGEETALLEVLDGRPPFPRIAPPWRRGVVEVVQDDVDAVAGSGLSADVVMASPEGASPAPPVLVNNVETLANVPGIIANGADWFRELGTPESPGSIVCTVTGGQRRGVVVEVEFGTPLRDVLALAQSAEDAEHPVSAVLMGVSNAILTGAQLDTALSYEAMAAIGSGVGSAGFIVVDERTDPTSLAAAVSRFLAIESCGQCTPCKQDGLEIFGLLERIRKGEGTQRDLAGIDVRLGRITNGARCSLATQHQVVIGSILRAFDGRIRRQALPGATAAEPMLVAELVAIDGETATVDEAFLRKQPDWTDGAFDSGETPVDRLSEHRA